ncbi:hypothetical protein ABTP07_19940, partial [Acinetobacter baumannii]
TARMLTADQRDETPEEMVAFWRAAGWDEEQIARGKARGWRQFGTVVTPLPLGYVRLQDGDRLDFAGRGWRVVVGSG